MTRRLGHSFLYAIGINYGPDARFAATPTWPALPRRAATLHSKAILLVIVRGNVGSEKIRAGNDPP
jgi:hypothetical protein